jgi:hypothetical protein
MNSNVFGVSQDGARLFTFTKINTPGVFKE